MRGQKRGMRGQVCGVGVRGERCSGSGEACLVEQEEELLEARRAHLQRHGGMGREQGLELRVSRLEG